jgi:hypothetical protein
MTNSSKTRVSLDRRGPGMGDFPRTSFRSALGIGPGVSLSSCLPESTPRRGLVGINES